MKKGWEKKKLDEVCQFRGGGTPPTSVERYWRGDIPWISPKDMKYEIVCDSIDHISDEAVENSTTSLIPKDSVLLVVRSGILARTVPIAITGRSVTINQDLKALCPSRIIEARFLYYLLHSQMDILLSMVSRGATVHRLMVDQIRALQFIMPPLPEQRRIVGILDEAFEEIATAKANAEKNLQNARELFESHLNEVFSRRGEGWVEKRLGDIAESISTGPFGTMLHKSDYVNDGIPLVNPMNIVDSRIVSSSKMMVNEATRERLRGYALKLGDIVIARRGELGRCATVTKREEGWLCGTGSFFVRLKESMIGEFFVTLFSSKPIRERLESSSVGTTMSNLNHGILSDLVLPLPPLKEQHRIMKKVDRLLAETQHLESLYQCKLSALEELKKSLLYQAFCGML